MTKRNQKRRNRRSAASTVSVITSEKRNITILSLDYDGCCDLLFEEAFEKSLYKNTCDPAQNGYLPNFRRAIQGARTALEDLLSIETAGADVVELCVGSARQTRRSDRNLSFRNKNGLCFELYADLAEKKHWHFNKMLYADFINHWGQLHAEPLKPGTAMGMLKKNAQEKYKYEDDVFADAVKKYDRDEYKIDLLSLQIKAIVAKYPNDKIKFVFVDDRMDIIQSLKYHFNPINAPNNSQLEVELKLINYDTFELLTKYGQMSVEDSIIIDAAKKCIDCVATLPVQEQALIHNSNKTSQKAIVSLSFFSKSEDPKKATQSTSVTNYKFIYNALSLIGVCLSFLTIGSILFLNARKSDNELPTYERATCS